jgi:hypothetical protein
LRSKSEESHIFSKNERDVGHPVFYYGDREGNESAVRSGISSLSRRLSSPQFLKTRSPDGKFGEGMGSVEGPGPAARILLVDVVEE